MLLPHACRLGAGQQLQPLPVLMMQIPGGRRQHEAERHRHSEGALPEGTPGEEEE